MTTVTIIAGNEGSGRTLIGAAIANYIRISYDKKTLAISSSTRLHPKSLHDLDDLILISKSEGLEPWMDAWIREFGDPLFIITTTRRR